MTPKNISYLHGFEGSFGLFFTLIKSSLGFVENPAERNGLQRNPLVPQRAFPKDPPKVLTKSLQDFPPNPSAYIIAAKELCTHWLDDASIQLPLKGLPLHGVHAFASERRLFVLEVIIILGRSAHMPMLMQMSALQ